MFAVEVHPRHGRADVTVLRGLRFVTHYGITPRGRHIGIAQLIAFSTLSARVQLSA